MHLQAWWYHKGTLEASTYMFMVFVGICLMFQAIVIDIYLWNWKDMASESKADIIPHTIAPITHSTTTTRRPVM